LRTNRLSASQKFDWVKEKADQLEATAKSKNRYLKLTGGGTIEEKEQVNDLIFESINAKLSLLQTAVKKDGEEI
jgi:hypothetical protein